jgi:hypothetical protein
MFSSLSLDPYRGCGESKQPCARTFDFTIDCHNDHYGIEKIKGVYNRVIAIQIFKQEGASFEPYQKFSACQFHGAFFANIRLSDCHHQGKNDIIAGVYDACSFPVGTLVLVNDCWSWPCPPEPCKPSKPDPSNHNSYTLSDNCISIHTW